MHPHVDAGDGLAGTMLFIDKEGFCLALTKEIDNDNGGWGAKKATMMARGLQQGGAYVSLIPTCMNRHSCAATYHFFITRRGFKRFQSSPVYYYDPTQTVAHCPILAYSLASLLVSIMCETCETAGKYDLARVKREHPLILVRSIPLCIRQPNEREAAGRVVLGPVGNIMISDSTLRWRLTIVILKTILSSLHQPAPPTGHVGSHIVLLPSRTGLDGIGFERERRARCSKFFGGTGCIHCMHRIAAPGIPSMMRLMA